MGSDDMRQVLVRMPPEMHDALREHEPHEQLLEGPFDPCVVGPPFVGARQGRP